MRHSHFTGLSAFVLTTSLCAAAAPTALASVFSVDDTNVMVLDSPAIAGDRGAIVVTPDGEGTSLATIFDRPAPIQVGNHVRRIVRLGHRGVAVPITDDRAWQVRLDATLRQPSVAGPAVLVVYEHDTTAHAAERGEHQAAFHTTLGAGQSFSARLHVSPDDGLAAGRVYHFRLLQAINGSEVVLAEGEALLD